MATITATQARFLRNNSGKASITKGGPEQPNIKEAASQTYDAGQPVNFSNGLLQVVADADAIATLAGIALKDATGVTNAEARYRPIVAGDVYVMNYAASQVTVQTLVGTIRTLNVTSGLLRCGTGTVQDGTDVMVRVLDLYTVAAGYADGDTVGDTNGRVVVEFLDQPGLVG